MAHEAGKGSSQRPTQVSQEEFASNWDLIFGKKQEHETSVTLTDRETEKKKINNEYNARAYDMAHSAFGRGHF